jgi:hypothetical protein
MDRMSVDFLSALEGERITVFNAHLGTGHTGILRRYEEIGAYVPFSGGFVLEEYCPNAPRRRILLHPVMDVGYEGEFYRLRGSTSGIGPTDYNGLTLHERQRLDDYIDVLSALLDVCAPHLFENGGEPFRHPMPEDISKNKLMLHYLALEFTSKRMKATIESSGKETHILISQKQTANK